ncbi:TonB-dependent receptor [Acidicapsa acidisoli]|uniref:TonB-dependent receptor n=1 Tax=Acidicapsa acidisoli TaxID=1615681 RepID=UPI0021E0733C|nr:TonB-dependent receptor [Acidicapsa acidisoli]
MKAHRKHILLAALVLVAALCSSLAFAQEETAVLNGQITDHDGLAVAEVKVQALNTGTNVSYMADTNETGRYNFPTLPVGRYSVTATKDGFQQAVEPGVELHVADVIRLNLSLQIGSVTQRVTVEGGAPLVETTSSEIGGLVNSRQIGDLPLNGRNYIDLSLLQAGVTDSLNSTGTNGFGGMTGTVYSSNGAPVISNNFLLDGTQITNQSNWGTASFAGTTLGVDGIQEYKVLTSAYDASYGMAMGSEMVIISKGGANQYHGDVFEYLRNSSLNARNFFDGTKTPHLEKNNFGASSGGPIRKDKTFFYAVYEGLQENLGFTANDLVPAAGCHGAAGAMITEAACPTLDLAPGSSVTIANADIAAMLSLYPNPNNGANGYLFGPSTKVGVNYGQFRFDQSFSSSDSFFARYTIDSAKINSANNQGMSISSGTAFPQFRGGGYDLDQFITLSETHAISPSISNTTRLAFSRTHFGSFPINVGSLPAGIEPIITGRPFGSFSITNLTPVGIGRLVGPPDSLHLQNIYSFGDDLYYQRGKHSLRFGTLLNRFNEALTVPINAPGNASYSSFANFLRGIPLTYGGPLTGSDVNRYFLFNTLGFYAQDDYRITSRFTVNIGLRYEFMTTPREADGRQYAIRNLTTDFTVLPGGELAAWIPGPVMRNGTYWNFSPRFGFTWDVFGDGRTAIRGGGGIYYDVGNLGGAFVNEADGSYPAIIYTATNPANAVVTFPITPPTVDSVLSSNRANSAVTVYYGAGQPYNIQYNLIVQRQLTRNTAVSVAYVGTRGVHLWQQLEGNPTIPTAIMNGVQYWSDAVPLCQTGAIPTCRINPNFGSVNTNNTVGVSHYDSLQVVVNKRLRSGLEAQATYTYGHSLDTPIGQLIAADCAGAPGMDVGVSSNTSAYDYGPSCFDARHNFRMSLLYYFPKLESNGLVSKLVNGWWMGNIVALQSGFPFTPILATNRSNSGNLSTMPDRVDLNTQAITQGTVLTNAEGGAYVAATSFIPYNPHRVITGNPNQWFNPNMFHMQPMVPCPNNAALTCGTLGDAARGILRGPDLGEWDFSLVKDTAFQLLGKQGSIQFRTEIFNILNHTNLGMPTSATVFNGATSVLGAYQQAPLAGVGQITTTATTSRQIQFALKLIF